MLVKRDRFLDVQPFHDGKTHRITIAEVLVMVMLNDLFVSPFVSLFSADNVGLPGRDGLQKVPCPVSPHAGQDQRVGFCKDEIRGEQEPLFPLRPTEQASRIAMMGISTVE